MFCRIALSTFVIASLLIVSPAHAGQRHAGRPGIHTLRHGLAPAPRPSHFHARRHPGVSLVRHGRRFSLPFEGIGVGGFGAGAIAIADTPVTAEGAAAEPYPYVRPDPQWQICQIGPYTDRYYECGPHSYHPFGSYGYRPNGTYGGAPADTGYVLAPNARIITIDHGK